VVRLGGKDVYCGQSGTLAAEAAYKRALSAWLAGQDATEAARPAPLPDAARASVNGLLLGYLKSALSRKDLAVVKVACREFSGLFGRRPAASCGPLCITEFQRRLVRRGCIPRKPGRPKKEISRQYVAKLVTIVRSAFKWATGQELVPVSVYQPIKTAVGLRYGEARETDEVLPVSDRDVEATLEH
jgi:hypothetical protein